MKQKKSRILAALTLALALMALTAFAQEPNRASLPEIHDLHVNEVDIECTDCHSVADDPAPGHEFSFSVRPGHDQCNICHEDTFDEGEFVSLCLTCHIDDSFDLGAFPSGHPSSGTFSHQQHVDPLGRVSARSGQRSDCVFCHISNESSATAGFPSHVQCKECHAGSNHVAPQIVADGSDGCQSCHELKMIDHTIKSKGSSHMDAVGMLPSWMMTRSSSSAAAAASAEDHDDYRGKGWSDVVKFPHNKHIQDRNGAEINCMLCHEGVLTRTGLSQPTTLPGMDDCAACHENNGRVGSENHIDRCEVCHTTINQGTLPGHKGHLSDIAHNPSFQVNHALQARDEEGYCTYCHDLGRAPGNGCDECHTRIEPKTHRAARFSETTHGRLASMDREKCAVCHEADFCIRCHNIPPRSHAPLPLFAAGFHRDLAALNLRSCFACHTFEADCLECHAQELRLPR